MFGITFTRVLVSFVVGAVHIGAAAQFTLERAKPAFSFAPTAVGDVVQTEQVRAQLVPYAPEGVAAGKTLWLGLQLQHQPHWHTYWKNPGDSGLATQLQWSLPAALTVGEVQWPAPQKFVIGNLANFGYTGSVLLPVAVHLGRDFQAAASTLPLELHAQWLVCREECIPQEGRFRVELPIGAQHTTHAAWFEAARRVAPRTLGAAHVQVNAHDNTVLLRVTGLPAAWQGQALDAFPETPAIVHNLSTPSARDALRTTGAPTLGTQTWHGASWSAHMALSAQRSAVVQTLPWVISLGADSVRSVAAVQGPWPTAAPVATVPAALQSALDANAAASAVAPTPSLAWLLFSALLGGLLLNVMPCVFPVLAIKVFGWSSAHASARGAHRTQGLAYGAGVVLAFMALGGGLLLLRAAGAQLGWGFQLQSPGVVAALVVLFSLIAANMAGLFSMGQLVPPTWAGVQLRHPTANACASGVLAVAVAAPCTAPLMGAALGAAVILPAPQALAIFAALGCGLALPYVVLSWVPGIGRWLPRPGPWMLHMRHFLAFLMAASALWLLWVLGQLSGVDAVVGVLALLLALGVLLWVWRLAGRSRWWLRCMALLTLGAVVWFAAPALAPSSDATARQAGPAQDARWQAWSSARVQSALDAGRPVFVDFTAAWCITCQYNKATTLRDSGVLTDFQKHQVVLLRADWTWRNATITQALQQLGRSGVPVYVLYQNGRAPVLLPEILRPEDVHAALRQLAPTVLAMH